MSILSALGFTLISLALGGYIVSLIRPEHRHDQPHDEHEDF
jgi:hypothetical protein